jgi:hypothetical protein
MRQIRTPIQAINSGPLMWRTVMTPEENGRLSATAAIVIASAAASGLVDAWRFDVVVPHDVAPTAACADEACHQCPDHHDHDQ